MRTVGDIAWAGICAGAKRDVDRQDGATVLVGPDGRWLESRGRSRGDADNILLMS